MELINRILGLSGSSGSLGSPTVQRKILRADGIVGITPLRMLIYDGKRWQYRDAMHRGHVFPMNAQQAKWFQRRDSYLDVLGMGDVEEIEKVFAEYGDGESGSYQYTKNKNFVRLLNTWALQEAFKRNYGL